MEGRYRTVVLILSASLGYLRRVIEWKNHSTQLAQLLCECVCVSCMYTHIHIEISYYSSYNNMMLRCWDANLQKRPTFSLLVKDIDKMVSSIADYLVMSLLDDSNTSDVSNSSTLSKSSSSVSSPLENQVEILILD